MPKTIRNKYKENLTYEKLMLAHKESQKGKGYRKEIIEFNLKQEEYIIQFIKTTYACIKNRGIHKACLDTQKTMKHCKAKWGEYYILKMDVSKYFDNIDKQILLKILIIIKIFI